MLTDGTKGSHDPALPDEWLRDEHEREQHAAAAVLRVADVRFLRRVDGELEDDRPLVHELTELVRTARPEVVLGHDPWRRDDPHPDHAVAGRAVVSALYAAREPRAARDLAARGLVPWRPRELLLFGAEDPDREEEVEGTIERKVDALLCHVTQHATSFGIHRPGDAERFAAEVRRAAGATGAAVERFRRIGLPT